MSEPSGAGWTSPQVITTGIGILAVALGSWLGMQRDDSKEVQAQLNDHARRIAILETRQEYLIGEVWEARQQGQGRGER